jgi:hypothetical protein
MLVQFCKSTAFSPQTTSKHDSVAAVSSAALPAGFFDDAPAPSTASLGSKHPVQPAVSSSIKKQYISSVPAVAHSTPSTVGFFAWFGIACLNLDHSLRPFGPSDKVERGSNTTWEGDAAKSDSIR